MQSRVGKSPSPGGAEARERGIALLFEDMGNCSGTWVTLWTSRVFGPPAPEWQGHPSDVARCGGTRARGVVGASARGRLARYCV